MKNYFGLAYKDSNSISTQEGMLKKIYDETDCCFENRFMKNGEIDELISRAKEIDPQPQNKFLYALVMGNLYLRKAQLQYENLGYTDESSKQANSYLSGIVSSENNNEIACLMLLNKGKIFRIITKPGQKSNYNKAYKIFDEVIKKASGLSIDKSKRNHIVLDAAINMGRVLRYSYKYDKALLIFSEIISKLRETDKSYDEKIKKANIQFLQSLEIKDPILPNTLCVSVEYVKEYLLQSLIHIGIILRKQRNYDEAINIFKLVNDIDSNGSGKLNIDAQNNLGVCFRKLAELKTLSTEESKRYYDEAIKIFDELEKRGNFFALINKYKCKLLHSEKSLKNIIDELKEKSNSCENNSIKMLLARFYEKNNMIKEAEKLYMEIYNSFPYITRGSIGLKAYYHVAQCKMASKDHHQAYAILEKIKELYYKNTGDHDLFTQIDLGWCLMQNGNYEEATATYESIYELFKENPPSNLETKYIMRICNNLCECYIHRRKLTKASEIVEKALLIEPDNKTARYFQAYIHLDVALTSPALPTCSSLTESIEEEQRKKMKKENLNEACQKFSELIDLKPAEDRANSGWFISKILQWKDERQNSIRDDIIKKLKYFSESVSMKCYILLTDFVLENIRENDVMLFENYCHIKLTDNMENYAFQNLINNTNFKCFDLKSQIYILAYIVKIYENILKIKHLHRFNNNDIKSGLPVHYTSLDTLKILLQENDEKEGNTEEYPKLRLWNTIYMNDDFEGGVFDNLLLKIAKEKGNSSEPDKVKDILDKYLGAPFTQGNQSSNVYIISFSKVNKSFQMWDIYAKKGRGCLIQFGEDYFDIQDNYEDLVVDEKFGNNTLYEVHYYKPGNCEENIDEIWHYLEKLDDILCEAKMTNEVEIDEKLLEDAKKEIRSFVTDKLNEIRYLFKTHYFEYEQELRLVRFSHNSMCDDKNFDIPRLYINVDKRIENIEVVLGNKLTLNERKELSAWLNNTNKVSKITVVNFQELV